MERSADPSRPAGSAGGVVTLPLLCAGVALIACCLVIPQADENRRLVHEREKLRADLEHIQQQMELNNDFLRRLADDASLAERLAQRQMKMVREGTAVLDLGSRQASLDVSPYRLVKLPPPPPPQPYRPIGGRFAELCRQPRPQLYMIGAGLMMVAAGLILGASNSSRD